MTRVTDEQWTTLARELAERLDTVAPGWTDRRDSDPGVTLLQLFAFLAESLLFRANAIPDRACAPLYRAFDRLAALRTLSCSETGPVTRVRYFDGQRLTREDLETEQTYFRTKHRLHNLSLHGVGIVSGLDVSLDSSSNAAEPTVIVTPGVAIAPNGDELVLCGPVSKPLCQNSSHCLVALRVTDVERVPVPTGSRLEASRIDEIVEVIVANEVGLEALALGRVLRDGGGWRMDSEFVPVTSARK